MMPRDPALWIMAGKALESAGDQASHPPSPGLRTCWGSLWGPGFPAVHCRRKQLLLSLARIKRKGNSSLPDFQCRRKITWSMAKIFSEILECVDGTIVDCNTALFFLKPFKDGVPLSSRHPDGIKMTGALVWPSGNVEPRRVVQQGVVLFAKVPAALQLRVQSVYLGRERGGVRDLTKKLLAPSPPIITSLP
jgi:hypothetical protein